MQVFFVTYHRVPVVGRCNILRGDVKANSRQHAKTVARHEFCNNIEVLSVKGQHLNNRA